MTEKTIYVAFDNTEFEDEDECIEYENQLLFNKTSIELWDKWGDSITDFSSNTFGEVCFIHIKNEDDKEFMIDNFPYVVKWDDDNFYFMSKNEQCFVSLAYYKNKYLEQCYLTALGIEEKKRGYKGVDYE